MLLLVLLSTGARSTNTAAASSSAWEEARATKPVLVATGDQAQRAMFPSSLNRFGSSSTLLLIAQGNSDMEMPKGGWGREFSSYDDGVSWQEVGPPHPSDGNPRKGVACIPQPGAAAAGQHAAADDQRLACIPFRLHIDETVPGNTSGVAPSLVWQAGTSVAEKTHVVETVNITVSMTVSGGSMAPTYPGRWGIVPDLATPVRIKHAGQDAWLLTLYGHVNGSGGIVALTSPLADGRHWSMLSIVHTGGVDGTACSSADENAVTRCANAFFVVPLYTQTPRIFAKTGSGQP